ncbi:MAG: exodeoxyribonuclease VII large subunit [Lachnospiraceae bacterium]|nr:exodeoxyribonuclease VII large subunit [Lachnospiraceae bacterium]
MTEYSVEQVNKYILSMFRDDYLLHDICVRGEISNCKYHSSGHIYFTLKDAASQLSCVMFASYAKGLNFRLENDMEVKLRGSVECYLRDGKYQLYVKQAVKGDKGDLARRFEELKKRLRDEGLFDESIKQPIPKNAKRVGIVTAPTGAAVHDIITVSKRRNPYIELILYPALVQGEGAKESIAKGITALEQIGVDVIIVGRGGGSMEDLWAFNEELVAQAIYNCPIPVISAVGHETDFTIADFVADLRAATPSAAAELAVGEIGPVISGIAEYRNRLDFQMNRVIRERRLKLEKYSRMDERMMHILKVRRLQTEQYLHRVKAASPKNTINTKKMESVRLEEKLSASMDEIIRSRKNMLALYIERLKRVSVLDRLQGGLGYVSDPDGKRLTSVGQFEKEKEFSLRLKDGTVLAKTVDVRPDSV